MTVEAPLQFGQPWIGDDLVDLRDPEAHGKVGERRFVDRIFTKAERRQLDRDPTDTLLWQLWSAKEATHKLLVKALGVKPAARHLEVTADETELAAPTSGTVSWRGRRLRVRWQLDRDCVHAVAIWHHGPSTASTFVQVARSEDPRFDAHLLTPAEKESARNSSSCAVRALAKSLAKPMLPRHFGAIEILRPQSGRDFGPPRLCHAGQPIPRWDLSLSHHGRFIAAALIHAPLRRRCSQGPQ